MATDAVSAPTTMTPARLLLAAMFRAMKPKQQARVLEMIGEVTPDNIVRLRAPRPRLSGTRSSRKPAQ